MEEDRTGSGPKKQSQIRRSGFLVCALVCVTAARVASAESRHFELDAGDARVMLNEFSRQADLQVLFDFAQLKGMQTNTVSGNLEPAEALQQMLQGVPVKWTWVNGRTLAITPAKDKVVQASGSKLHRWWQHVSSKPAQTPTTDTLDQVLVAANNVADGEPPLGAALIRLTRLDIERSGYATAQDFVHTLPQVFGGGPSEDTQLGREATTNPTKGSGINLRGLDAGATLVLMDGMRLAPSGGAGLYTDISNIPLSAVDHVDILPDGASAQYGADAIGGVANFVLRSDFVGAETQLRDGTISGGALGDKRFSQLLGLHWDSGHGMLGFEYYDRDAVPASDRLQATSDLRSFGGNNFDTPYGSPGTIQIGQQTWAIPAGLNKPLTAADLVPGTSNLYDQWRGADILPHQQLWSAFATLRHALSDSVDLFADSMYSSRSLFRIAPTSQPVPITVPASNPFYTSPTVGTGPVTVLYGAVADFGAPASRDDVNAANFSLGMATHAANGWTTSGYVNFTFEKEHLFQQGLFDPNALGKALADPDPQTAFDPFGDGSLTNPVTLAGIARSSVYSSNSNLRTVGLTGSGPLFRLPGGAARLTLGAEYREQTFDFRNEQVGDGQTFGSSESILHRTIRSVFAEVQLPLIGPTDGWRFARRLEVSVGGRTEDYSDVGRAGIPKFGVLWAPAASISLRGTWTKAFRPPALTDVVAAGSTSGIIRLPDPSSPSGFTTALFAAGTNPDLQQERARTWTIGAEITPPVFPGLSLAITYFSTFYGGRIEQFNGLEPDLFSNPSFAWLIDRSFTAADRQDICSQTTFRTAGSCLTSQIGAIVDNRLRNIEHLETRGIDLLGKFTFENSLGAFETALNGTYLLGYSEAKTPGSPTLSLLNTANNPLNLRVRGSLSWQKGSFGTSVYLNFDNGYRDTLSVPNRNVRSWTTVDLQLRYRNERDDLGLLSNLEFAISAQNLFNSSPPFLNNSLGIGYDEENADLIGRIVSLDIRKRW